MDRASLQAMLKRDFLAFDGLEDLTYVSSADSGNTTYTVNNARITFQTTKGYGEPEVKGYQIDEVHVTFPVDELAVDAKDADTFTVDGNVYEVMKTECRTARTRWMVTGERAFIESAFAQSVDVERATLTLDSASATSKSWAAVYASQTCVVKEDDNTADMIPRLGVRADKGTTTFYFPQTLDIQPTDRIKYGGRYYRITYQGQQRRVARLQFMRAELYA